MGRLSLVLLASCILLSLSFASAENISTGSGDVPTSVFVEDSPPYIIQNIPDIFLIGGENSTNFLDLDDYFGEDNGEELNITFSSISNITITIDSEHRVSFYPDPLYMGTQELRFSVADNKTKIDGNWFNLTVGQDTLAPKWFNVRKNRASVYQNYNVEFATDWTDNMGLANFIFFINQGAGWVQHPTTLFSGLINTSKITVKMSASPLTTVSWKFSATDIYGNTNETTVQSFTIKEFDYTGGEVSEDTDNDAADDSGDSSVATQVPAATIGEFATANFKTDVSNIKLSMRQGDVLTKIVKVTNTGGILLDFTTRLGNLNNFAMLSDSTFSLESGETHELLIDFNVSKDTMPDQYFGYLVIEAGEEIEIPIVLDVRKFESEISINVMIPEKYKAVKPGREVKAIVAISSIRDVRETDLSLVYSIKDFKGNILESGSVDTTMFSSTEESLNLTVPKSTEDGEYLFYVRATGEDIVDIGSDVFFVGSRFQIARLLEKFLYPFLFLILFLIIIILITIFKKNKKRQKALELYVMLNELRGLVKEGKTSEAAVIYKRIKVTYGQHISKDFKQNQEKFKIELNKFSKLLEQNPIKPDAPTSENSTSETSDAPETTTTEEETIASTKVVAPKKPTTNKSKKPIAPAKAVAPKSKKHSSVKKSKKSKVKKK